MIRILAKRVACAPCRPGEFEFATEDVEGNEAVVGLSARCPCGCGGEQFLDFSAAAIPAPGERPRIWDGNCDQPTVSDPIAFRNCKGRPWTLVGGFWLPA